MEFSAESFAGMLALVGVVIIVASLMSGVIERSSFPQVAVFLALGAVLGPPGLGLLDIHLDSPILRVVATLSLALVLFTDALSLNITEARKHARLAFLVLGPGTLLTAALVTLVGWWLLGLPLPAAAIVGAAIASTDPVILRGLLRNRNISGATRQALRLESGLNDVVLLPIVLVAMTFLGHSGADAPGAVGPDWVQLAVNLFVLGPGAGIVVALLAVATLDLIRRRIGVRRDYESIYSLGVAFAAFALAESLHGSGFLAAFAAGLTISALDVELCDCFLEYGETTAEMALLFAFVLFGSSLIWSGLGLLSPFTLLFVLLVFAIRPLAFGLSLLREKITRRDRLLISWLGPSGLSTLLLVLLPVFDGVEGGAEMFSLCALVVLASVVVHGGSIMALTRTPRKGISLPPPPASDEPPARSGGEESGEQLAFMPDPHGKQTSPTSVAPDGAVQERKNGRAQQPGAQEGDEDETREAGIERISLAEVRALERAGEPVVLVDARTERTYDGSEQMVKGAVRLNPNMPMLAEQAREAGLPKDAWLPIFCA
ncbi:MAG: cation:proton antiporter [Chloroflexia bacterium]